MIAVTNFIVAPENSRTAEDMGKDPKYCPVEGWLPQKRNDSNPPKPTSNTQIKFCTEQANFGKARKIMQLYVLIGAKNKNIQDRIHALHQFRPGNQTASTICDHMRKRCVTNQKASWMRLSIESAKLPPSPKPW
jgi:hypothetical protein